MPKEMITREEIIAERKRIIRENLFFTVEAVAEMLCVSKRTVQDLQTEGKLYRPPTGRNIIPVESFVEYRATLMKNYRIDDK